MSRGALAARGPRRAVVGMLTGCVQSVFFPRVNAATARVLAAEGCDVIIPRSQGCCGALSLHSGRAAEAVRFAQQTIETFEAATKLKILPIVKLDFFIFLCVVIFAALAVGQVTESVGRLICLWTGKLPAKYRDDADEVL